MLQGLVVKGYGGFYFVITGDETYICRGRGRLKRGEGELLAGDRVLFNPMEEDRGVIEQVLPRKNTLIRPPVANVDQILLVFSLADPVPDLKLLDRLLVLCEAQRIAAVICFNKRDLVSAGEAQARAEVYRKAGYPVHLVTARSGDGVAAIAAGLKGKITVVAGPSGAGKSTLINAVKPGLFLQTGDISARLRRGKHTTRHVELLPVAEEGYIADTPGFSNLYLPPLKRNQLDDCFPEINRVATGCRFLDCLHHQEPDCAVKEAISRGVIDKGRYQNYLDFLSEVIAQERMY